MAFSGTMRALSDPTRREILSILKGGSLSAGDIAGHFPMSGATISHHLNILREAGLVSDRRAGRNIYYELNTSVFEELLAWASDFLPAEEPAAEELSHD